MAGSILGDAATRAAAAGATDAGRARRAGPSRRPGRIRVARVVAASTAATPSPTGSCATHTALRTRRQQALLGAWRDLPTLRDTDRFDAWLHRLVVHACYAEARGERRHVARVRALPHRSTDLPDVARSVAARDDLDHAFRQLSPEQRAVVVLHHHLGYPLTEIAATLGIPVGTARSRLHYAVRQLRTALDANDRSLATSQERPA